MTFLAVYENLHTHADMGKWCKLGPRCEVTDFPSHPFKKYFQMLMPDDMPRCPDSIRAALKSFLNNCFTTFQSKLEKIQHQYYCKNNLSSSSVEGIKIVLILYEDSVLFRPQNKFKRFENSKWCASSKSIISFWMRQKCHCPSECFHETKHVTADKSW